MHVSLDPAQAGPHACTCEHLRASPSHACPVTGPLPRPPSSWPTLPCTSAICRRACMPSGGVTPAHAPSPAGCKGPPRTLWETQRTGLRSVVGWVQDGPCLEIRTVRICISGRGWAVGACFPRRARCGCCAQTPQATCCGDLLALDDVNFYHSHAPVCQHHQPSRS
jgi:hypothetical protein